MLSEAEVIIKIEAKAWVRKYFKADSVEYLFFLLIISGIKDNKFTSKPSQAINHEFAEIVIITEVINEIKKRIKEGWINN